MPAPTAPVPADDKGRPAGKSRYIPWAELLRKTFGFDVGGRAAESAYPPGLVFFKSSKPQAGAHGGLGLSVFVESLKVKGNSASVTLAWSPGSGENTDAFTLRKVGGRWRVVSTKRIKAIRS